MTCPSSPKVVEKHQPPRCLTINLTGIPVLFTIRGESTPRYHNIDRCHRSISSSLNMCPFFKNNRLLLPFTLLGPMGSGVIFSSSNRK